MTSYPRLERYLARLPRGIDSYPECVIKGSAFKLFADSRPLEGPALEGLPASFVELLKRSVGANDLVPETYMMALLLAVADHGKLDDAQLVEWARECNASLLAGPMYRVLMAMASPGMLVGGVTRRWGSLHRGTSLELAPSKPVAGRSGADMLIRFPQDLFDATMLQCFGTGVEVALAMSRAKNPTLELVDVTARSGIYRCTWS